MGTCERLAGDAGGGEGEGGADVPRCLLACQPTNQRPHGGAAGRARAIKKGSPTIISTVVSGDSVQQNDLRGQVDLIGPGS